jgi:hypothetical protein
MRTFGQLAFGPGLVVLNQPARRETRTFNDC